MPTIAATVAAGAAVTAKCKPHICFYSMLKNVLSESKHVVHICIVGASTRALLSIYN